MTCQYAQTCRARILIGDLENGCDKSDQARCGVADVYDIWYPVVHVEGFAKVELKPQETTKRVAGPFDALMGVA